jgi:hypothetical protein
MKCYHNTFAAEEILANGFKDATGYYLTATLHTGVWFADRPLDVNEGADGDVLLAIDIPENLFAEYEWVEEGKGYREALIPAALVNPYGPARIADAYWAHCGASGLLQAIAFRERLLLSVQGEEHQSHLRKDIERIQYMISFLGKHGLLDPE